MHRVIYLLAMLLALALAACGGGDDDDNRADMPEITVPGEVDNPREPETDQDDVPQDDPPHDDTTQAILDAYIDEYVCTDERDDAVFDAGNWGMARWWNGEPFIVDVSATFTNADELLDAIADEAEKIRDALGYEIFVAGNVLPMPEIVDYRDDVLSGLRVDLRVPEQHVHINCCAVSGPHAAGTAHPGFRLAILVSDAYAARYVVMHELYHLLGFGHPGDLTSVQMSHVLMYGYPGGPTTSMVEDLAKLACIYD